MGYEKTLCLKNGSDYVVSPDEALTVIEKFSYSFRMFVFLLVIGIINDQQYSVIFFEVQLFEEQICLPLGYFILIPVTVGDKPIVGRSPFLVLVVIGHGFMKIEDGLRFIAYGYSCGHVTE